jgi:hypothetical protein
MCYAANIFSFHLFLNVGIGIDIANCYMHFSSYFDGGTVCGLLVFLHFGELGCLHFQGK